MKIKFIETRERIEEWEEKDYNIFMEDFTTESGKKEFIAFTNMVDLFNPESNNGTLVDLKTEIIK